MMECCPSRESRTELVVQDICFHLAIAACETINFGGIPPMCCFVCQSPQVVGRIFLNKVTDIPLVALPVDTPSFFLDGPVSPPVVHAVLGFCLLNVLCLRRDIFFILLLIQAA